ncbi:hypothetical protein H5410_045947 [Solanum commersonii]|uniref:Reverse transcriptase domain-containing protein n=1 Tax=Solanum commersonii TaxID=4109 RepID=A0A9J5XAY1_SOLCO|nr:hypothetical protein H5410_045947 [Solanum commersonii]
MVELLQFHRKPDYILVAKLKALKEKLKEWRKTAQGNLGTQKQNVLKQLAELEEIQENRSLRPEEITSKTALISEFEDIAKREEIAWRQRSRAVTANAHRRINTISKLKVRGENLTEPEEIQKEIAPFEQQEILESTKACAGDKAPRPDGYSMAFFSQCWDIIKTDLVATVQQFHKAERFKKSINATFVALIPKKVGAKELTDFRPISLIGGIYKIIAKLLAERLKNLFRKNINKARFRPGTYRRSKGGGSNSISRSSRKRTKVSLFSNQCTRNRRLKMIFVDSQQMAFIKGRQIMDAVLIANECVESRQRSKCPGILCKLDIQKGL